MIFKHPKQKAPQANFFLNLIVFWQFSIMFFLFFKLLFVVEVFGGGMSLFGPNVALSLGNFPNKFILFICSYKFILFIFSLFCS